jgi:hypothetical protein
MNNESRVWLYQSSRVLTDAEVAEIQLKLNQFTKEWVSHSQALTASGNVLHHRFILLMVDENKSGASGCSIDSSVRFLQDLGMAYATDFFDRLNFAYLEGEQVKTAHKDDFAVLYYQGKINDDTIVFNNLVKDAGEMKMKWQIPLKDSWHKNFV